MITCKEISNGCLNPCEICIYAFSIFCEDGGFIENNNRLG